MLEELEIPSGVYLEYGLGVDFPRFHRSKRSKVSENMVDPLRYLRVRSPPSTPNLGRRRVPYMVIRAENNQGGFLGPRGH
jgi:hypothetical protein